MLLRCINPENAAIVGGDSAILIKNLSIVSKKFERRIDLLLTSLHILTLQFFIIIFQVEQLTNHLPKEKTDKCSELLLSKEQLQRDIQSRNEEIEKLEFRVRELEQALLLVQTLFQKV